MGFFPPNMYDPQINMIRKPFELNKERLRKDFNSPKYENRRKEFFATFSEYLRSYIRDKYYEFMNDIQTEVNFFEWFDHYYNPNLLAGRNTNTNNTLLQKEVIKNSFSLLPSSKTSSSDNSTSIVTKQRCLTSQNKPTIHSQNTFIKANIHTPPNILSLTKNHASDTIISSHAYSTSGLMSLPSDKMHLTTNQQDKNSMTSLTPKYQITDNTHLDKKQMQTINRTTQIWLKVENKEVVLEEFLPYESIVVNHRNHQLVASPIKKVSLSDEAKNFEKIIEQNNYSNTYLIVIGAKLDRIENKIDPIKPTTKLDIEKPLFTPHEIPPKLRVSFKKDNTDLDYINQHPDDTVSINFQPFRKSISSSSCSTRYSNPYKEKIVSPPRCNFSRLKLQEIPRVDDDLRHSIDRLDNLRFAEEEDRSQKLDLDKIRKSSNNSNYTNPNLDGIIKGNVINTPFYPTSSQVPPSFHSMSSQFPKKRPNSPTNSDMGFFPLNMYDPQINMIRKPFELNKERLRKDFNSPKYENRRKEFFATFSEYLRSYIRDKYYEFMNDIQTEVNFFEWFDHYYKPKLLAGRNTNTNNTLLQKEVIKNSFSLLPSSKTSSSDNSTSIVTKQRCLTSQNKPTIHSQNTFIKANIHTPPNILPLTKNHASDTIISSHAYSTSGLMSLPSDKMHLTTNQQDKNSMTSLTPKYQITDNTHLDKKQMQTINRTTQNWLKVENKEVVHEEFLPYESIVVNHRNHQLVASPIKKVSLSDEAKNFEKIIEQNNYSNTYLKVIGAKLDRIENKIDPIKPTTKLDIEKPLFTPHEIPPKLRVSFKKDNTDLLEEISKRLQNLDMTSLASSSQNNQIKRVNTIDKKKQECPKVEEYIENLQNQFKDLNINRIANERDFHGKPLRSRISRTRYPGNVSITRNFYPRPTPPDLQFEEREVWFN
jgi:hypothetical protein